MVKFIKLTTSDKRNVIINTGMILVINEIKDNLYLTKSQITLFNIGSGGFNTSNISVIETQEEIFKLLTSSS